MKKILMVLFLINSFLFAQTDLIISEYVEGSGNNEAIEIYNGTSNPISLSGYSIGIYYNGQTSAGQTIVLTPSATIAAGDVYVVVYTGASLTLQAYADQLNGNTFNGNDALVLQNGSIVDVIGQVGFNPGAGWGSDPTSTVDHTLRRKTGITSGDTNPSDTFDPSVEWDGYAVDTFDGLGNSSPLPVELTSFSAAIKENSVELKWQTATEVNNYGFELLKSKTISPASSNVDYAATAWTKIGFVAGAGNSNSPKEYSYVDNSKLDGKYQYRLKQIDIDGNYKYSNIVEVKINSVPNKFSLSQNYPNPFNPATVIRYSLSSVAAPSSTPSGGRAAEGLQNVTLKIYDVLGNEVTTLVNENQPAGNYEVTFNASGLASGVYLYKLQSSSGFISTKKLVLLK